MIVLAARRVRSATLAVGLYAALIVSRSATVAAQSSAPPTDDRTAAARADFDVGLAAARDEHWGEALVHFRRVYQLTHLPSVLLNIGGALVATGHLVEAADTYRQYLRDAPASEHELRDGTVAALADLTPRIPHARIAIVHLAPDDAITLDGTAVTPAALDLPLAVDPGSHVIVVQRSQREIARTTFETVERHEQSLRVELPIAAPPPQRWWRSPVVWTIAGGLVVGAAVGVGLAVYYTSPEYVGNIGQGWTRAP